MKRRIGLLGGTFDPIHFGHLQLAELALIRCNLTQVLFLPSACPPHKDPCDITEFQHRVNMLKIALAGRPAFRLSSLEATLPTPSYTIDTLTFLINKHKNDDEFYFIIGEDAFLEIVSWKSYEELLSLTHFIVSGRKGYSDEYCKSFAKSLGYVPKGRIWLSPAGGHEIIFLPTETDNISSTAVREMIRNNMLLEKFVPGAVIEYIYKNKLYGCSGHIP